jgi:ribonuclease BN (tRNA processing enzyme)
MSPVVFPVPLDDIAAEVEVRNVEPGTFTTNHFTVRAMMVRHPGTTMGYVLQPTSGGATLGYVTDNELSGGNYDVGPGWKREFVEFVRGVNVLVHDAMYTTGELQQHIGWGHSSNIEATQLAVEAQVDQLVLFHHRPEHDDGTIDAMVEEARGTARRLGSKVEIIAAQEGMDLHM